MTIENNRDEININELFKALWFSKRIIIIATLFISFVVFLIANQLEDKYTSKFLLAPNSENSPTNNLGSYGALAAITGIDMQSSNSSNKIDLAIARLLSLDFFEKSIYTNDFIMINFMGIDRYDPVSKSIIYDTEIVDVSIMTWKKDSKPSLNDAFEFYLKSIFISEDKDYGLYDLKFKSISPKSAFLLIEHVFTEINKNVLEFDRSSNIQSLEYLNFQLSEAREIEIKKSIASLIEEKIKAAMMMEITNDYVFTVIDSARPGIKTEPNRIVFVILGAIFGVLISSLSIIYYHFENRKIILSIIPPKINITPK